MATTTSDLDVTLPSDTEIRMTRSFAAPPRLVWAAFTEPKLMEQWMTGPSGWVLKATVGDVRVGASYRLEWHRPSDGAVMGAGGIYLEVRKPERLSCSERFDDPWYPGEAINSYDLEARGAGTVLHQHFQYESKTARDMALASHMDDGMRESYRRLDGILAAAIAGEHGSARA